MRPYYPLGIRTKVIHRDYGFIPNKKFSKCKRELDGSTNELGKIFANIFRDLRNCTIGHCRTNLKKLDLPDILKVLNSIIPDQYFGSKFNRKKLFFIIKRILSQTNGEFIHTCTLFEGYEYEYFSWLDKKSDIKEQIFNANLLLLQTVVKPLIRYFYYFLCNFRNRKILIIPNGLMHSFTDRNINKYLKMGIIEEVEKKNWRQVNVNGALRFIPKTSIMCLDARPIVLNYEKLKWLLASLKKNLKSLIKKYQVGSKLCLYDKWRLLNESIKKGRKLYGIKLDFFNAFGMVNLDKLATIIREDDEHLTEPQKEFLYKRMSNQYVHIQGSRKIFRWRYGLLQGTNLSPTLCELYLSYLLFKHLGHFDKPNTLIHRTVDDIFFISTWANDIYEFDLAAMKMCFLNQAKTVEFVDVGEDPHLVYCGKIFNLVTREISNSYVFEKDVEMRVKFKFWNPKNPFPVDKPYEFIVNSMKFAYVNFCFTRYELNTTCNSIDTVIKNIFDGMCFVAFKLDCAIESIAYAFKNLEDRNKTVGKSINFIIFTYTSVIIKTIENFKGENYEENLFNFRSIKFLFRRAFLVVLRKRSLKYTLIIEKLKRKTNFSMKNLNTRYYLKLPKVFENIKMRRKPEFV